MSKNVNPIILHISNQDAWRLHNKGCQIIQYESPTSYKYQQIPKDAVFSFFQAEGKSYALVLPTEDSKAIHDTYKFLPLWGILFFLLFSIGASFLTLTSLPALQENHNSFTVIGLGFSTCGVYALLKVIRGLFSGERVREEILSKYQLSDD